MTLLLTQNEVQALAKNAGHTTTNARIASAIAMVESASGQMKDGVPAADAHKVGDQELATSTWGYSYGLWQIRSLKAQTGTGGIRDANKLLDPVFNAKSAYAIYVQQGWDAWSVYTGGQYKAYLPEIYPPPPNTHVVVSGDTLGEIADKYNTTVAILTDLNNLADPNKLSIGQHIKLPGAIIVPPPPYVPPPFPTGLAPDKSVPSAKPLQAALKTADYMLDSIAPSDNYGPKTQEAVARFHNDNTQFRSEGTTYDVKIGPKGWDHLHRLAYDVNGA